MKRDVHETRRSAEVPLAGDLPMKPGIMGDNSGRVITEYKLIMALASDHIPRLVMGCS